MNGRSVKWLARLFRPHVELPDGVAARVHAWRALPGHGDAMPLAQARFVSVDVETTGLDARRDRLLAIGAVTVADNRLRPGEGFEAYLRTDRPGEADNVLVHGITPRQQAAGDAPEAVLIAFLEYARRDLLVAFHAPFDQVVLDRAARENLGVRLLNPWIDLAQLAPALYPEARLYQATLDDWLRYFGLRVAQRHRAACDAFASAELFLILLARARSRGLTTVSALRAVCEQQARLLPGGGAGGV